jgi:hypothetical protein
MAMDPEELVTLTDHGTMKLRSAVVRAMILPAKERKRAKIVREGEPAILIFKQIRNLGAKWDERRGSSPRGQRRFRSRGHGPKSRPTATLTIPAEIHEAVMALPPNERHDRAKVNEAVRKSRGS